MKSAWSKLAWVLVGSGVSFGIWKEVFHVNGTENLDSNKEAQTPERLPRRVREVPPSKLGGEKAIDEGILSATSSGSFERIKILAMTMSEEDRLVYFLDGILPLKTKFGLANDLLQKREILMSLSGGRREISMKRLLHQSGQDLDSANAFDIAKVVTDREWEDLIVGKCQSDPAEAFLMGSQLEGEKRRITNRTSVRQYLEQGSIAAGEFVQSLKPGPDKDDAVAELVKWLTEKGDLQAAKEWSVELSVQAGKPFGEAGK